MSRQKPALESTVTETVHGNTPHRVDREKGVIFGVKILGSRSGNGYEYTREALKQAAQLYTGRPVNIDHSSKPGQPRSAHDRFGRIVNAEVKDDGVFGDVEYLKSHPLAGIVTEAAERMPEAFGLSHEARVKWRTPAKTIAESILTVKSVDLVADPATTSSLFEQRSQLVSITLKQIHTALTKAKGKTKPLEKARKFFSLVCEQDGMAEMPVEVPAETDAAAVAENPDDALLKGFIAAMKSAIDSYEKGDLDSAAMLAKVEELAGMLEQANGGPPGASASETPAPESKKPAPPPADPNTADVQEARKLQAEVLALRRENLANRLCRAEKVELQPAAFKALCRCEDEAEMKEFIQEQKAAQAVPPPTEPPPAHVRPKSGHQGTVQEQRNEKGPESFEDYCKRAFGRSPSHAKN